MDELKLSRYTDYKIKKHKRFRVEVCIAEIHYNTSKGKKHKYFCNACKFPDGTIRTYNNRYSKAYKAQDALDRYADTIGWSHAGFNSRLPVIDCYDGIREKKEIVPVYN